MAVFSLVDFLADVVANRSAETSQSFNIEWIPAHQYDHIPIELVTEDMARCVNTTLQHIANNRLVDRAAREFAVSIAPIDPQFKPKLIEAIRSHQQWLVGVHASLPTHAPDESNVRNVQELPDKLTSAQCRLRYPQWPWDASAVSFKWKPKIPVAFPKPKAWDGSADEWETTCTFLRSLRWCVKEDEVTSLCELTALFHFCGYKFDRHGHDVLGLP